MSKRNVVSGFGGDSMKRVLQPRGECVCACVECGQCVSGHLIWIVNVPSRPSGQLSHIQLTFQAQAPAPLPAAHDRGCPEPLTAE